MNEAVISVGSNINPHHHVKLALENIKEVATCLQVSHFYVTTPMEFKDQDDFLNGAFLVTTAYDYDSFNRELKKIEKKQGRVKTENKAGPRCIDLDIIVWNENIVDDTFYKWDFIRKVVLEVKPQLQGENIQEY